MKPVERVYVSFGSNLGDRLHSFHESRRLLAARGWSVRLASPVYETAAWGGAEGGDFLNAVFELEPNRTPRALLQALQSIERELGRPADHPRYAARTCDLDLLLWRDLQLAEPDLIVPHPHLTERRFVLVPLIDLIPDRTCPGRTDTFQQLLAACPDPGEVRPYAA